MYEGKMDYEYPKGKAKDAYSMDYSEQGIDRHGMNYPESTAEAEDFGEVSGGTLANGLYCKKPFMDYMPEELGMGTAGPNQTPIGPAEHTAPRGHRWG